MSSPETAVPAAEAVKLIGKVISGRYLIQQLLGEGGMGSVYLAEHTHMKKHVAIKLLHPEMIDNAEVSARFEREAMAAAHIEHPNVAGATDFGKTEDGAFFLVLEYVEGTSLRDVVAEGPISAQRAMRITRQIALALERAHEAGIVHRDLKPENVMLVKKEGEPDFVKVLDFGIAKVLEGAASASAEIAERQGARAAQQPLTRLGTILGTPEYMAPEQALGEPVTPAADLYGVGVILYEMLTGKHPFDVPDRMAMLSFHIVAPVPLMHDRAPGVDVPPMVEAIVRCLLEKDAKKRYANARALIEAIESAAGPSGIDLGIGSPPTPSQPGAGARTPGGTELARVAPESSPRGPGWIDNDAFAKTSFGVPAANTTTANGEPAIVAKTASGADARTRFLDTLNRQPRNVLIALAAALPLVFILLIVLVVLAFRGPKAELKTVGPDGGTIEIPAEMKGKAAPAERIKEAVALGPDALEALAKEYPDDPSILRQLAVAYAAQGKNHEALTAVRALLVTQPAAANDDEIIQLVTALASKGQGSDDDEAFALLEGPLGAAGVDALIELTVRAPGREGRDVRDHRARAARSLANPEVRAHASPAAAILLDFKTATTCAAKHDLLGRAKDEGDARLLPALKPLKFTRGCGGFLRAGDCHPCMRRDSALDDAIAAVEARPGK